MTVPGGALRLEWIRQNPPVAPRTAHAGGGAGVTATRRGGEPFPARFALFVFALFHATERKAQVTDNAKKTCNVRGILLTIGDELLLGDIANGNAHYIAYELRSRGFLLDRILTVGDAEEAIVSAIAEVLPRCDFLIVTGGLGPTDDDRTCPAAARALGRPLVKNAEYEDWLRGHVATYGLPWSKEAERMTFFPEGARKIGLEMAGFAIEHGRVPCYFLPGVPHEMKTLMKENVLPDLETRFPLRRVYMKHVVRVQGLFESQIHQKLAGVQAQAEGVDIGYLPRGSEVWVTLFAGGATGEEARAHIRATERVVLERLGRECVSGYNEDPLERVVGEQLRNAGWTLAVAESCTGGLIARRITSVAGASDYFDRGFITYSNRAKTELLGVPEELLVRHGAVSAEVAKAMAEGARERAGADAALAVTGIAGPTGGTAEKPVGTVFMACAVSGQTTVEHHLFGGFREHIQEGAAQTALQLLWRTLSHDPDLHRD